MLVLDFTGTISAKIGLHTNEMQMPSSVRPFKPYKMERKLCFHTCL
jgi:hypothetical protein